MRSTAVADSCQRYGENSQDQPRAQSDPRTSTSTATATGDFEVEPHQPVPDQEEPIGELTLAEYLAHLPGMSGIGRG